MPKEIAHFTMARMTGKALGKEHAPFREAVEKYPALFVLGGVAPDINFYCMAGPGAKQIQALSAPFHQSNRKALLPVLEFLDRRLAGKKLDFPALALAAGAVCHIMADTVFHPLVYYFAGMDGVHPGATARHRQFETAMDLYFWQDGPGDPWLGRHLFFLEIPRQEVTVLLADLFHARNPGQVNQALGWHTWIQYLFFAPWVKKLMTGARRLGLPFSGKATGLAYPFRHGVALPFFSEDIVYWDPVTRKKNLTSIRKLTQDTVDGTKKVLALAAEAMGQQQGIAAYLRAHPGLPQVRPGLPEQGFSLWKKEENIMPRIYRGVCPPF